MNSRFILPAAAVLLTAAVSFGINALAATFSEPSSAPPSYNAYAPLDTSGNANTKSGGLILNTGGAGTGLVVQYGNVGIGTGSPSQKLDVAGYVMGESGLCIGGDCRTSWPSMTPTPNGTQVYSCPVEPSWDGCSSSCDGNLSTNSTCTTYDVNCSDSNSGQITFNCTPVGHLMQ